MKIDPQTIEHLNAINKKYIDAANNHDAAARAALYTEDAVFVTHSGPLYGRQAIEKCYADEFKAWPCSDEIDEERRAAEQPIAS
jgi:uncharacterized protein (TIGR02246 family)